MGGSGLLQLLQGIMDKESIRVIGAHERGAIDASTLIYKFVLGSGTAAVDWLDNGDLKTIKTAPQKILAYFHEFPINWIFYFDGTAQGSGVNATAKSFSALFFD